MIVNVDTKGLSCPEPVLLVQDALKKNPGQPLRVEADRATPRDNIVKLAQREHRTATVTEQDGIFVIDIA